MNSAVTESVHDADRDAEYDASWRRTPASAEQIRNDRWIAVGLFVLGILSLILSHAIGGGGEMASLQVAAAFVAITILPLAWRRTHPTAVAVVVAIAFIVGTELLVIESILRNIALFSAIYTVGAWERDRRRAAWVRGGIYLAMGVWLLIGMFLASAPSSSGESGEGIGLLTAHVGLVLQSLLVNVLYFGGAHWFGERAWAAERQRDELQRRTEQLSAEQARVAQQAVTIERMRIARELHDAVAHHVSLMGVQAAAARSVLPTDIDGARAQLSILEDSARSAVAELYALLGTLRDDDETGTSAPAAAMSGVDGLTGLIDEAKAAGLDISMARVGESVDVPPLVGLNLYRIVQEALANVVKHAGPGTRTVVRVRYLPNAVEVEITNDAGNRTPPKASGAKLGLVGMRERVSSLRGELTAKSRSNGGFVVRARIPTALSS